MSHYVFLQLIWIGLGVGFNLVSYFRLKRGKAPLMQTPPLIGIGVLGLFIPIILLGVTDWHAAYLILNLMMALFISYIGIIRHLQVLFSDRSLDGYASRTALLIGVGINVFGVGATVWACVTVAGLSGAC
ncbi:MAG: hypothetical protein KUG59_00610 [Parvibaculaceae bacterium]|nr:hypothetical protein [Parvibaculaceae bacterium]